MKYQIKKKSRSFTLIEIMVTLAVLGLALPALFSMFFVLIRQQVKIYKLAEVKRQGDYLVSFMETAIREATDINSPRVCKAAGSVSGPPTPFDFYDHKGNSFRFSVSGGVVRVTVQNVSGALPFPTSDLTNSKVNVSVFGISCQTPGRFSGALVNVSFTVTFSGTAGPEGQTSLDYETNIKLRST